MFKTFPIGVSLPQNAVLTFTQQGSGTETDPATGNVIAVTTEVEVGAALTELGDKTSENDQVGLDTRYRNMRGYLLGTLPAGILLKGRVACTIGDETGTFHFTERISPYKAEIEKLLGTPIQGSFQTEGGGR
ncbi:hypothetical protein Lepto7375DRAFT_7294 [Leptolyngbya sp. PCC 7375]|nr:hypothetical protein Lepto7375DRAFT_7294 [Leptolyngbya sp. PCC 7375]